MTVEEPPDAVRAAKAAQRTALRALRRRICADPADRAARSARIWEGVVAHLPRTGYVMLFESLSTEPDTTGWIAWCVEHGVPTYVPAVDGPDLRVVSVDGPAEDGAGELDPVELDLVVVPGLAFTPAGDRLGQGGGHYDRFLTLLRPGCVTIGVCFFEQLVAAVPAEPHDRRVDRVVTDVTSG